ncbi:MAG: TonB-dependent receptor [Gammaproteobacteria bacterium]|nr:TonB-dependent receptor [Gammaproteobacteria bacterium]
MERKLSIAIVSTLILSSFVPAATAAPVTASESTSGGLEEVTVTAQKRRENLQETPIAISVLSAAGIEDRQVYSLVDLGDGAIPSLKIAPFFSRPGALITNIRGVGVLLDSNQPARDQGVGMYVDGVYLGRPQGLGVALYDVDSIEVLKGPQGTLFGRNTEGGAVSITTKRPTGEFGLVAKASVANFNGYQSEFQLNFPKFADLSVKVGGVLTGRDGWVANPLPQAEDFGGFERRGFRARVLWAPTADISADYAYDVAYDATTTLYQQYLGPTPLTTLVPVAGNTASTKRIDTATFGVPQQKSVGKTSGHRLTGEWTVSDSLTVKSITAYRDLTQDQWDNGSAALSVGAFKSPTLATVLNQQFGRYSLALFNQDQFSQEIDFIGATERLKWTAGALYFRETVQDNARAFTTNAFTDAIGIGSLPRSIDYLAQRIDRASKVTTTSQGVFGQATYTPQGLDDKLHVTAGGRWTKDEKVGRMLTINDVNFPVGSQGQIFFQPGTTTPLVSPNPLNTSWSRFDPIFNVAYDVTDDVLAYARYASGYKSGGANSRSLTYKPFGPETVEMVEIGSKMEFFDRRARLNVAVYDGKYKDIQVDFSAPYLQGNVLTNRTTTETINAPGKGKLQGVEADLTFAATDDLTLSASYAYNKAEIPATQNPFPQIVSGAITIINSPIPIYQTYSPEKAGSVAADYQTPFMGFKFALHLDANFSDGFYTANTDFAFADAPGGVRTVTLSNTKGDSSMVVNGRMSLADIPVGGGMASVSIWSRNLLDEEHVFYRGTAAPTTGYGGFFNEPRTFGIEFGVKF